MILIIGLPSSRGPIALPSIVARNPYIQTDEGLRIAPHGIHECPKTAAPMEGEYT